MATTNTCKKCGCEDSFMPSPAPCPTPQGCPNPEPCSEVMDAQCVIYTGNNIVCDQDIVVTTNDNVTEAIENIVDYFCNNGGQGPQGPPGPQGLQGPQGVSGPVGPAGLNWQGAWSAASIYVVDDAVGYGGASWFCINPVGPSATPPNGDPTNWALLAAQGATGPQGPQGVAGPQGPIGPAGGVTQIIAGTNVTISPVGGTGAVTINSSGGGGSTFTYEIGQYVPSEGGVIAHRWLSNGTSYPVTSGTEQCYLVIDIVSLTNSAQWASAALGTAGAADSTYLGIANTAGLIGLGAGSGITAGTAAVLCNNSTNNGKTDWFLPAIDELSVIWQNRWAINQGLEAALAAPLLFPFYWSSTQATINVAWTFDFTTGTASLSKLKTDTGVSVRAIRAFSI